MRNFDSITKYHDKTFNCDATLKAHGCEKSPFTSEYEQMLDEFEKEVGEIKSITIVFKK